MPGFDGASEWINSDPLTPAGLRGGVVVVQFWTYTCINWLRTLPYIRAWYEKYRDDGVIVIGVHTPEFGVEHDLDHIHRAVRDMRIEYPVAVDSDYRIWDAFANRYWPAAYFVDAEGSIRAHQFGEGRYEESEGVIRQLLTLSGRQPAGSGTVTVVGEGAEAPADWGSVRSQETYAGYGRAERFESRAGIAPDTGRYYAFPESLRPDHWALAGNWTIGREQAHSNEAGGRIAFRFQARDLHLVMGTSGAAAEFRVLLDGGAPGEAHGVDVDPDGRGSVSVPRLYQLIRQPVKVEERTFEIVFAEPGAEAFVFTFG
jgi:thiol-disulfide isomerase/thioredoxin